MDYGSWYVLYPAAQHWEKLYVLQYVYIYVCVSCHTLKNEGMNYTINMCIVVYTPILGDMSVVSTLLL